MTGFPLAFESGLQRHYTLDKKHDHQARLVDRWLKVETAFS